MLIPQYVSVERYTHTTSIGQDVFPQPVRQLHFGPLRQYALVVPWRQRIVRHYLMILRRRDQTYTRQKRLT